MISNEVRRAAAEALLNIAGNTTEYAGDRVAAATAVLQYYHDYDLAQAAQDQPCACPVPCDACQEDSA